MRLKCVVLAPLVPLYVPLAAAQDASAPAPASTPPVAASILPPDLSAWGMIAHADIVVKAVIAGLAFASVLTWTVALVKGIEIVLTGRRMRAELAVIRSAADLMDAERQLGATDTPCSALVQAAREEETASAGLTEKDGIKERAAWRLDRLTAAAGRHIGRGVGVLATIGATAPFVGLFGTVWGIMNSFIGISRAQTTNLAVVAPGIAEALLATATGLVAAIPAVVVYNVFARATAGHKANLADAVAETMRLLSRDLDRAPPKRIRAVGE